MTPAERAHMIAIMVRLAQIEIKYLTHDEATALIATIAKTANDPR